MSDFNTPAFDDVSDADEQTGGLVDAEHDLDVTKFAEESDDE